jgi:hypothetical protein
MGLEQTCSLQTEMYRMTEENSLLLAPIDKIAQTNVFGRKFSVEYPSYTDWLDPGSVLPPNILTLYTDGSLLDGRAGAGVYLKSQNTSEAYSLGTHATVFQSEFYTMP